MCKIIQFNKHPKLHKKLAEDNLQLMKDKANQINVLDSEMSVLVMTLKNIADDLYRDGQISARKAITIRNLSDRMQAVYQDMKDI